MLKVLFLISIVMVSFTFAQRENATNSSEKPNAALLEEFAAVPNGQIRSYLDNFFYTLQQNPTAKGYIFVYGKKTDVAKRERLYRNHITFRKFDPSQIKFGKGKIGTELKTQLWIVPEGAEPPKP